MAVDVERLWCEVCQKRVKAERQGASHVLHLLLTLCTFGLWAIVWLIVATGRAYHCTECGATAQFRIEGE